MPKFQHCCDDVMSVGEYIRLDHDPLTHNALQGEPTAVDLRGHPLDHDARTAITWQWAAERARRVRGSRYAGLDHLAALRQTACLGIGDESRRRAR